MIADHVVFPVASTSRYPYTVSGEHPSHGDALEQLAILSFVAGATETLRLVTSVMILPYRNPVVTAKALATADVLSGGRITVGVGERSVRDFRRKEKTSGSKKGLLSLKRKKQRNFSSENQESFLVLFFKKERLSYLTDDPRRLAGRARPR